MNDELFVAMVVLGWTLVLGWSFRHLTREDWQFLGAIPRRKQSSQDWQGINLTYYGFFNACAYVLATALALVLLRACAIPVGSILTLLLAITVVCAPASRVVARVVEKKRYVFSIGAASFIGILLIPGVVYLLRELAGETAPAAFPPSVVLAAVTIAYAFGEGVGRLACISFGCCYGKPISRVHPRLRRLFAKCAFTFRGATRKAVYADGLDGIQVVPIQAITAVVNCLSGTAGLYLYLKGLFTAAFLLPLIVTQLWRFGSEFLRADHRGGGRLSAYQLMAAACIPYGAALSLWLSDTAISKPQILRGLALLWQPGVILMLQGLWITIFLYTGRSQVTAATMSFHVIKDRI